MPISTPLPKANLNKAIRVQKTGDFYQNIFRKESMEKINRRTDTKTDSNKVEKQKISIKKFGENHVLHTSIHTSSIVMDQSADIITGE